MTFNVGLFDVTYEVIFDRNIQNFTSNSNKVKEIIYLIIHNNFVNYIKNINYTR